jgi:hypothetical protein
MEKNMSATEPIATSTTEPHATKKPASRFSWDTWAVFAAFLAALLIRFGVIKHVPW